MDTELAVGLSVGVAALVLLTVLVVWCRQRIEHIARGKAGTAREILRDLHGGG